MLLQLNGSFIPYISNCFSGNDIHSLALRWHGRDKTVTNLLEVSLVKLINDRKTPLSVLIHLVKLNSLTPLFTEQIKASQSSSAPLNSEKAER